MSEEMKKWHAGVIPFCSIRKWKRTIKDWRRRKC